jgi:hypothetical protein
MNVKSMMVGFMAAAWTASGATAFPIDPFVGAAARAAALVQPGSTPQTPPAPSITKQAEAKKGSLDDRATDGKTRAAVITFGCEKYGDMVGIYAVADVYRRVMKDLKDEKVDIVVVRVKSGGGYLLEIQKLSDVFHNEYKNDFRLVAWIDSAISAAAMSAHCFEEIYFTPQGNYGACTGWSGRLQAMKGLELEEALLMMEKISARGNHDHRIMRAMQISGKDEESAELKISPPWGALSANINSETGEVEFFQDTTTGSIVLNPSGGVNVLTFNAITAEKVKFSSGTASTMDELAKAMGLTEVEWVGRKDKEYIWPISRAEDEMLRFRKQTKLDESSLNRYYNNFLNFMQLAQQANDQERPKFLGQARTALSQIKNMVKNNPNFALLQWGGPDQFKEWVEEREKEIRELARPRPR